MNLEQRKAAFVQLGQSMKMLAESAVWPGFSSGLTEDEFTSFQRIIDSHHHYNGWFTRDNILKSLNAWGNSLKAEPLEKWLTAHSFNSTKPKNIGIICAGNIPLVGFHDLLSVLISGHRALVKQSTSDNKLIPALLKLLVKFEPEFEKQFELLDEKLTGFEAVIATGSNNTSRYFHYYFKDVPHVIRKSRTSVAVLSGNESPEQLTGLGNDVFDHFGLGCRNVSRLFLPEGYDLDKFFNGIFSFGEIIHHNKYANNYDYNKAVWLLNQDDLLDNGFILLKKDVRIASPTASLFYSYYKNEAEVNETIAAHNEEIQCVVGSNQIPFGQAQSPELWDYADGVDTLQFITSLK